jgi:N-acetylmuramoyl-L-alanine amidase
MNIIQKRSPNFFRGRKAYKPEAIVIHVMDGTLSGTDNWFGNTQSKVSAHYGVGKSGEVHQYVDESNTAWHAGRVYSPTCTILKPAGNGAYINPNYYTIGIEHEGTQQSEWTDQMYKSSSTLLGVICKRWNIPLDRTHVIGHHEVYALKPCPGYKVDINKLIALALGGAVMPAAQKIAQPGVVTTQVLLNIRSAPNRNLTPLKEVVPNTQLPYAGFTNDGEKINGIGKWYYTSEGNWFWSGGVK